MLRSLRCTASDYPHHGRLPARARGAEADRSKQGLIGGNRERAPEPYSAGVAEGCTCPSSLASLRASQRLWCSLAQLRSTSPVPIASNAPSIPSVPI